MKSALIIILINSYVVLVSFSQPFSFYKKDYSKQSIPNSRLLLFQKEKFIDSIDKAMKYLDVVLPTPEGAFITCKLTKVALMQDNLERKYSSIKRFRGKTKISNNSYTIDMLWDGVDLRSIVHSPNGTFYIDPIYDSSLYEVYYRKDYIRRYSNQKKNICYNSDKELYSDNNTYNPKYRKINSKKGDGNVLKQYVIAIATTSGYSNFHINKSGNPSSIEEAKKNSD